MSEEEKLYRAEIVVLVRAVDERGAKVEIASRRIWVDDILEIKQENLEHLAEGSSREAMRQVIFKHLQRVGR